MPESTFLKLKDEHGVTADGNLEPLVEIGLVIPVPVMIPNPITKIAEPGESAASVTITPADRLDDLTLARIVPGTRLIEVADSRIAQALLMTQNWEQVDPPTRAEIKNAAKASTDAATEAGTHDDSAGDGQED